jgi:hypothetical protein
MRGLTDATRATEKDGLILINQTGTMKDITPKPGKMTF